MHLKRKTIPKTWPIAKTGSKYLALPLHNQNTAISLIVVMRDVLGLVKTKKELKKALNEKKIQVNGKIVREENYPINLFDCLAIPSSKQYLRLGLKNKRMNFESISEKESTKKIYKVINKKILAGKKVQINLSDGKNILSNEKINVGDFIFLDNSNNKIVKIISLKKDAEVLAIKGKHIGKSGKIKEISKIGENDVATIITKDKTEIQANVKNLFALE